MSNNSTAGCPKCAGQAACWCSLSPIALDQEVGLDFEAAKKTLLGAEWDFPKRVKDNLDAQLRALVARVAQEEREKVFKEVMAEWTKPTIRTHAEAYQYVSDFTCWLQGRLTDV